MLRRRLTLTAIPLSVAALVLAGYFRDGRPRRWRQWRRPATLSVLVPASTFQDARDGNLPSRGLVA